MLYANFPNDDKLYFVKWIDRFVMPLDQTRSAGVHVMLQDLGIDNPHYLLSLGKPQLAALLAKPTRAQKDSGNYGTFMPVIRRAHAASLPLIPIGGLFRNRQLVGIVQQEQHDVIVKPNRSNCHWIKLKTEIGKPAGWNPELPYFTLNNAHYEYVKGYFSDSEVFVIKTDRAEFLIPAVVMFQAFYGPESQMIRAFTGGPWETTASQVIHFGRTESGLETHVDASSGEWHIILQQKVRDIYARHLAMLWFDPYARKCAESIYTHALMCRNTHERQQVHLHAELPYRPEYGVKLKVKGLLLTNWKESDRPGFKRFLVTSILAATPPTYLPNILSERVNSGLKGRFVEKAEDAPAPYSKTPPTIQSSDINMPAIDDILTAGVDGSLQNPALQYNLGTFEWTDAPDIKKIPKEFSRSYPNQPKPEPQATGLLSTGDPSYAKGADRLNGGVLVRDAVNRFTHLLQAMEELTESQRIENFGIIQPSRADLLLVRGGVNCWNFLSDEERRTGRIDKRGWAVFRQKKKGTPKNIPATDVRAALIISIQIKGVTMLWFEIECNQSEALTSLVLRVDSMPSTDYFVDVLQRIVVLKGRALQLRMQPLFKQIGGRSQSYKHQYKSRTNPELDPASIERILKKLL